MFSEIIVWEVFCFCFWFAFCVGRPFPSTLARGSHCFGDFLVCVCWLFRVANFFSVLLGIDEAKRKPREFITVSLVKFQNPQLDYRFLSLFRVFVGLFDI